MQQGTNGRPTLVFASSVVEKDLYATCRDFGTICQVLGSLTGYYSADFTNRFGAVTTASILLHQLHGLLVFFIACLHVSI